MWEYEYSLETSATAEELWRHWADMPTWPEWNDGIETIDVEGPFDVGTIFTMTPPGNEPIRMRLVEIMPGEYFTDEMDGGDFIAQPAVIDTRTGKTRFASLGPSEFAGECVPVAKRADATSEDDVWLLTLVLDGAAGTTELRVLDGGDVAAPPVARVRLPHVVPFGFHGNWVAGARGRAN